MAAASDVRVRTYPSSLRRRRDFFICRSSLGPTGGLRGLARRVAATSDVRVKLMPHRATQWYGGVIIFYLVRPRVRTRLPDGRNVRRMDKNNSLQPVKVGGSFSFVGCHDTVGFTCIHQPETSISTYSHPGLCRICQMSLCRHSQPHPRMAIAACP